MSTCLQEDCANWDGNGCPCRVLDLEPVDVRDHYGFDGAPEKRVYSPVSSDGGDS